jgi:peptide/nickel transport system permease protein
MNLGRFLARRLVQMIPVLLGVTLIVFALLQMIPGDPVIVMLGPQARAESVAAMRQELGLDRPLPEQYVRYLGNLLRFDLGDSLKFRVPVASLLRDRLEVSLVLIAYATVLMVVVSLPVGIVSALRKDGWFDQVMRGVLMVGLVTPAFLLGIIFLTYLSVKWKLFPVSGYGDTWPEHLHHLFLPALTIAISIVPILVRALRTSILEAMGSDYVRTARAKGLREQAVVVAHVLRNALIPALTLLGLSVGYLMGGTVIVENVFSLPGAGKLLIEGISARDYPLVQSTTLIFATLVILVNLVTDGMYTLLDPRVRL